MNALIETGVQITYCLYAGYTCRSRDHNQVVLDAEYSSCQAMERKNTNVGLMVSNMDRFTQMY